MARLTGNCQDMFLQRAHALTVIGRDEEDILKRHGSVNFPRIRDVETGMK
jgi:hypothetical protein